MSVMQIRPMAMGVLHWCVSMRVCVGFINRITRRMFMLVVFVMTMTMAVVELLMGMVMAVTFGKMQPSTECHQQSSNENGSSQR